MSTIQARRARSRTMVQPLHGGSKVERLLLACGIPISGRNYDVSVERMALSAAWFVTPTILLKGEYVTQKYSDFPTLDIRSGGKFDGFVVEGSVAF